MEASEDVTTPLDAIPTASLLRFGAFELDIEAERLLRNGRNVRLQPQPFRLLCLLVGQAGRVVTREDIRATLWTSDTFVDFEQGVNFAIKQVREALGEDADHPIYIQTIPKRGYKFVAPVEVVRIARPQRAFHRSSISAGMPITSSAPRQMKPKIVPNRQNNAEGRYPLS